MDDACRTKQVTVEIQENGIIRGPDGDIIGRLSSSLLFADLTDEADAKSE